VRACYLCILTVALASCSSKPGRVVLVYSPHGKEMLVEFEERFERAHPGVDVQWLDMGSQDAYDRIRTERENPQADVWWGAPSIIFARAERESLLLRYVPTYDSAIAKENRSADRYWYGTFLTPEVIMYNSALLPAERVPLDWDDLLAPEWNSRIIIRYPLASGTMRIIFSAIIDRERKRKGTLDAGFEWLRQLDANTKSYVADPTQLYLSIARGEGLLTLWNLPDVVLQATLNRYPFAYVIPKSGTPLITDGIAIVRGTKNLSDAQAFYEFVTSPESQIEQAVRFYRIPARTDIDREKLPSWIAALRIQPMDIDWDLVESHEREWMKRWDEQVKGTGKKLP
jgi:iron(III) transport system substrate-binding protein